MNIGMAFSFFFEIVAIEWRTYEDAGLVDIATVDSALSDILDIPP